jgi:hypothetical protein
LRAFSRTLKQPKFGLPQAERLKTLIVRGCSIGQVGVAAMLPPAYTSV